MAESSTRQLPSPEVPEHDRPEDRSICSQCIDDDALKRLIDGAPPLIPPIGEPGTCSYCSTSALVMLTRDLAQFINGVYRRFFEPGGQVLGTDDHGEPAGVQEGQTPMEILSEATGADEDFVADVIDINKRLETRDVAQGAHPMYEPDWNYSHIATDAAEALDAWATFSERIKHRKRFFDDEAQTRLADLLGDPEALAQDFSRQPVRVIEPGDETLIYRARVAATDGQAMVILGGPAQELGAPPGAVATAGRMNPAGIPVFYGAFDEATAIAEVRPSVGATVIAGAFKTLRQLRLLDLAALETAWPSVSMFDHRYPQQQMRLEFLRSFQDIIAQPLGVGEPEIEFLPTQSVSEYVRNVLGLDGIVYRSAQTGGGSQNIALFQESAVVAVDPEPAIRGFDPSLELVEDRARAVIVTSLAVSFEERSGLEVRNLEALAEAFPQLTRRWNENALRYLPILLADDIQPNVRIDAGLRMLHDQQQVVQALRATLVTTSGPLRSALERVAAHYATRWSILRRVVEATTWGWDDELAAAMEDYNRLMDPSVIRPMLEELFRHPLFQDALESAGIAVDQLLEALTPPEA